MAIVNYNRNVIRVKVYSSHQDEATTTVTTTPGMLMERHTAEGSIKPHASAGGVNMRMFADRDELQGKTVDDDYAANTLCFFFPARNGDLVNALLTINQDIAYGDLLVSNGDGTLKKASTETGYELVGIAREAVDTTDSLVTTAQRILVEVL